MGLRRVPQGRGRGFNQRGDVSDLMALEPPAEGWPGDEGAPLGDEREPPWACVAEQSVLGGLLNDNAAFPLVSDMLVRESFYRLDHQRIYAVISDLLMKQAPADTVTVLEVLRDRDEDEACGGVQYLEALAASMPSARNIRRYAEIVAEKRAERLLIAGADDALRLAWNGGLPLDARIEQIAGVLARVEQQRKNPGARVPMLRLSALQEASARIHWVVKHVVPAESIGLMFGGSGTFKSFIAVDCALHVAHGLPWMGRRTNRGAVLYIAAEGGAGLWNRIEAWHRERELSWLDVEMVVVPVPLDLAADAWRVVDAAQATGITPALVVVDTLSQTYSGDENSANEVAAYLRELGLRFRALWRCSVMLIHHTGHQATERPRGTSALRANVDYMLGVFRDEKEMLATLTCVKQKDGELFKDASFGLTVSELGMDEDNDPVTTLVARHLGTESEVFEARQREAMAGRGGRNQKLMSLVQNGMAIKELRKAFYEDVVAGLDAEAKKKAFYRAKDAAVDAGLIEVVEGLVIDLRKGQ